VSKLDYLKRQLADLSVEQRQDVDDFMLNLMADDAETKAKRYELELATDFLDQARDLRSKWGKMQGLSTGYQSLDRQMLGIVRGEVIVVAGATSKGKTALAVNITGKVVQAGVPVLFVTLEMTKPQLASRLMYCVDNFDEYAGLVAFQKSNDLDWRSVDGLILNAVKEMRVGLVVIDHLHYFSRELERLSEDLGRITKEFKRAAATYDVPIMLISHVRKTDKGKKASMDDLRGSSYIAQDADVVLMVDRDNEYPNQIIVTCEKNRNRGADLAKNVVILDFNKTKITERSTLGGIPWL
jgi:replicative DNA helicase